jgi:glycerol dehydrogenase
VIYPDTGEFEAYQLVRRNPAPVLVDTSQYARRRVDPWCPRARPNSVIAQCFPMGSQPQAAVRNHTVTPALERIVEANTLRSGLGFESSGLAAAHAIHDGLTAARGMRPYLHGERSSSASSPSSSWKAQRPARSPPSSTSAPN